MSSRAASCPDGELGRSFEEEWPELARQLERFLTAKGVDRWLRADVVQETGLRLFQRWETLDHTSPMWNLAATIAMRVVHNHRRKESRIELVADPIPTHQDDVHVRGLQRAQLKKTRSALLQLNADQRDVLLAEVGEAILPPGTRNRINVVRLRARGRLRDALGPWAPSGIAIRFRHLRARIARTRPVFEMYVPAMTNSLVNLAVVATVGLAGAVASSVDVATPVQPERSWLLSSEHARAAHLDPIANPRHAEPPDLSRTQDDPKQKDEDSSGPVDDTKGFVENQTEWVDQRQQEVRRLGEDGGRLGQDVLALGEDAIALGRDVVRLGRDVVRLGRDVVDHVP